MTDSTFEQAEALVPILMPYAHERRQEAINRRRRFVHYASAESAMKIIQSQEIWLRDARCMSDYSEVHHGYARLARHFGVETNRNAFLAELDACGAGVSKEVAEQFDRWSALIPHSTYLCCISEHDDSEDAHGRLSMWRAYGRGSAGVALVLRVPVGMKARAPYVMLSPVAYLDDGAFDREMARLIETLRQNRAFAASVPRPLLVSMATLALIVAAVSLKHPGFHEEREWRVIYLPNHFPSALLSGSTETIAGVPQTVYKLPFKDVPEGGVVGMDFPKLFDRLIVGPSPYPGPIAGAFISALKNAGITDAEQRVVVSDIPLRP